MNEFLTAAIVGTAQYKGALPITHSAVDTLANQLASKQKERDFLLTAGARAIYLQAGHQALTTLEPPVPAEPETLQPCSEQVGNLIIDLFIDRSMTSNSLLLPEALQRLHTAQLRVPHSILSECLAYATLHKESRAGMIAVLGERARWLGKANAAWSWINDELSAQNKVLPADAETIWQEGPIEQRQEILQRLRAQDPEKALSWLQAIWQSEKAETRIAFISCLQEGISSHDQAFIEQALEDRSEGVRQLAVSLLHAMPEAPKIQAMFKVVSAMLDYKNGPLQKKLTIKLPEQVDMAWKNTISIIKVRQDDQSDAKYWLQHAFTYISPQSWEEHFSISPDEFISVLNQTRLGKELLQEMIQAALFHHTSNWYAPLLAWYIEYAVITPDSDVTQRMDNVCKQMFRTLAPSQQETLIVPLQAKPAHWEKAINWLPAPWSLTFSHDCMRVLKGYSPQDDAVGFDFWSRSLPIIAQALHPSCLETAQELWQPDPDPANKGSWHMQRKHDYINAFIALIQLRTRILEEIN
jgi:hypothetical protein